MLWINSIYIFSTSCSSGKRAQKLSAHRASGFQKVLTGTKPLLRLNVLSTEENWRVTNPLSVKDLLIYQLFSLGPHLHWQWPHWWHSDTSSKGWLNNRNQIDVMSIFESDILQRHPQNCIPADCATLNYSTSQEPCDSEIQTHVPAHHRLIPCYQLSIRWRQKCVLSVLSARSCTARIKAGLSLYINFIAVWR